MYTGRMSGDKRDVRPVTACHSSKNEGPSSDQVMRDLALERILSRKKCVLLTGSGHSSAIGFDALLCVVESRNFNY